MFMSVSIVDMSAVLGLIALILLTLNFLLGLLLVTSYKKTALWKRLPGVVKQVKISRVHNWTAYVAFALILLHPLLLMFDSSTKFHLSSILAPFAAPVQPAFAALGTFALYAL